jgi:hypothetical protein
MEHLYIRKVYLRLFVSTLICLVFLSCASQKTKHMLKGSSHFKIAGRYQKSKGNEVFIFNADSTFIYLRNYIQKSDVVISLCDTLAKGFWKQRDGFITLKNNHTFNSIDYSIVETELQSKDSVYFKIVLPEEDALNYKNFKFSIIPSPLHGQFIETDKPEFAISKKSWGNVAFTLLVQNIAPNCNYGRKAYQRIYFDVFEGYRPKNNNSNCFTITLINFNQCFYEAMDVDGEVIGIESDDLFWSGSAYKKIN